MAHQTAVVAGILCHFPEESAVGIGMKDREGIERAQSEHPVRACELIYPSSP